MTKNPLLTKEELPRFDQIKAEHVHPAILALISESENILKKLEENDDATWDTLINPLCEMEESIHRVWGPIVHLKGVASSNELREAYEKSQKVIVDFNLRYMQSEKIFEKLLKIKNSSSWTSLESGQKRSLEQRITSAELAGLSLKGAEREEFNEINKKLSQLQFEFSNNVLDSSKEFSLVLKSKEDRKGLPESLLNLASLAYTSKFPKEVASTPEEGPWLINLDPPLLVPFLENSENREYREQVYRTFLKRASSGKFDNTPKILEILKLRKKMAQLLKKKNYAEVSLSQKMVPSVEKVFDFEEDLRKVAYKKGIEEFKELSNFAKQKGFSEELKHWDIAFWTKRLQEEKLKFSDEELKPYFSFEQTLDGLFKICEKLFSIEVSEEKGVPVWNKDVRFYKVYDSSKNHIASFYLDAFSRPEDKRGGAWMDDCKTRYISDNRIILPVAYIVCNFPSPTPEKPSLLSFQDVTTIFHEFGHALQHMLTTVDVRDVSGTNGVEWDAIELASQFMENWCYHKATLKNLAKHYKTGESLPDQLIDKLIASKTFRAATHMLRQIHFALTDMKLHSEFDPDSGKSIFEVHKEVVEKTSALPYFPEDRLLCSFTHIFAGGYAAGYYSYKWAELMSADAFGKFEEEGLDKEDTVSKVGKEFRDSILALGGSIDPAEVFKLYRGRDPSTEALLRHSGLSSS